MRQVYLGIDPGASGGIASINWDGELTAIPMPSTERDVFTLLSEYAPNDFYTTFAVIEKVGGFVGKGGDGEKGGGAANGSAMFKFGMSYGGLRMALIACGIPFSEYAPVSWQPSFSVKRGPGEKKNIHKNRLKAAAQQLFPSEKITLSVADAVLLAEFARRLKKPN